MRWFAGNRALSSVDTETLMARKFLLLKALFDEEFGPILPVPGCEARTRAVTRLFQQGCLIYVKVGDLLANQSTLSDPAHRK